MPLWLTLLIIGVILAIIGFAGVGQILIWIGVILLVVGVIGTLVSRGRGRGRGI
jgi:membrane protein implicated in regulation of membrane protease activity